jgi:hypothetical protein
MILSKTLKIRTKGLLESNYMFKKQQKNGGFFFPNILLRPTPISTALPDTYIITFHQAM